MIRSIKSNTLLILCACLVFIVDSSASLGSDDSNSPMMTWYAPPPGGKVGVVEGLDLNTLEVLTESGILQYYQPRREKDRWDVVSGMMVHAPADMVWEIVSDHVAQCRLLPDTFDSCEVISKQGNKTTMHNLLHTSISKFSFKMDIIDEITDNPPRSWHIDTIEGSLKGRELDLVLIPAGDNRTMVFQRYFGSIRTANIFMRMVMNLLPDFESPAYAAAATYHVRAYKNEAQMKTGYVQPKTHAPLDYSRLDPKTMNQLGRWYGGLVRETAQGKTVNAMAFASIDAPVETVWKVMADFEHYGDFFPDTAAVVEKREKNEVVLRQTVKRFNVLFFDFEFDLTDRYLLEEPRRMSWNTIGGTYKDSKGEFVLVPYDNGKKTFAFATTSLMTDRDDSLAMSIVKSGAFPFESMVNMSHSRAALNGFKREAQKRQ